MVLNAVFKVLKWRPAGLRRGRLDNGFFPQESVFLRNIRWWRKQIGFVGQEPVLFNTTVRENLMYGLDASDTHVNDDFVKRCEEMCNLGFLYKRLKLQASGV